MRADPKSVRVGRFRFWWSVDWVDPELGEKHGTDGECFLLFRRLSIADEYAEALRAGRDTWDIARRRLW
jgi:hypothetical protein